MPRAAPAEHRRAWALGVCARFAVSAVALAGAAVFAASALHPADGGASLRAQLPPGNTHAAPVAAGGAAGRRLQLLVSTNASDPKTPTPVVAWPREWMPVRVTIKAGAQAGSTDDTTVPRVVYSWRHPEFPVTCRALQHEEVALGAEATLPLFYESQTIRAVACARGERASNETVVRVEVSRYAGVSLAAAALIGLIFAAAIVGGIFTWLCLPGGAAFSVPSFLLAIYPTLAVAFTATALFDFLTLGAMEPAFIIIGVLGLFAACNAAASAVFFRRDMPRQKQADYRYRRWANKHQVEHGVLGCCASACGVGCVKLIYSRFLRLWTFSPDFKAPPGFAPSDIGAGGVQGQVSAAGGGTAAGATTAGGAELDASANPTQAYDLDSPIPPHAEFRLDVMEALPLPLFHAPLLALGIVLELRLGLVDWASPSCVVGLIAFHGVGLLVFLYLLYRVCTYPSKARFADRRRFRAVVEGRSTLGSSGRDSEDSDAEESKRDLSRRLSRSSRGSKRTKDSLSQRDVDRVDAKELERYRRQAPGQPSLLFVQADRDARRDLSKTGQQGVDTAMPGVASPRMGKGGRNAVITEKRMREEARQRRLEERRQRRLRGLPSLEDDGGGAAGAGGDGKGGGQPAEDPAAKAQRLLRERKEAARARKDKAARRWRRAVGTDGYGEPEPEQAEQAEAFNMRLQKRADAAAAARTAPKKARGFGGALRSMVGRPEPVAPQPEDDLEVEMVAGDEVALPGGGVVRAPPKQRVVAKPAVTVGQGRDRRTVRVAPDSPRALEAAARQKVDFDQAVRSNPFHPLHNAPSEGGRPAGGSKAREATRAGRKDGEALPIPAAGQGRRRSVALPGAGKMRTAADTAVGVLSSSGAVARGAASRGGAVGGAGASVGRSVAAQTLALRRLAEQGRPDLVPSAKRRDSDEDSFDDDL